MEHRMGFEPMNTGFADQRVSHFAIGAFFLEANYGSSPSVMMGLTVASG
jgi:hypothetical protein